MHKGTTGGSLNGRVTSRSRQKRDAAIRRNQDKAFSAKNGEVVVSFRCVCPSPACKMHAGE